MKRVEACAPAADLRPTRREQAAGIAGLAADGISLPEIACALGLPRERVLRFITEFRIRVRPAGEGRGSRTARA